jgi:hypothetical protein
MLLRLVWVVVNQVKRDGATKIANPITGQMEVVVAHTLLCRSAIGTGNLFERGLCLPALRKAQPPGYLTAICNRLLIFDFRLAATLSYSVRARRPAPGCAAVADITACRQVECRLPLSDVDSPLLFRAGSSKGKRWNCLKASFSVGLFGFAFILVVQNTGERYFVSTYLNE